MEDNEAIEDIIAEATFDYTMGEVGQAIGKLESLLERHPAAGAAWHSLAEIRLAARQTGAALAAGEKALELLPEDLHIHVTLSRIWVELGNKEKAEHYGAQARMLGWKATLRGED